MKALITGASSGIGRDIARELNKRGYELILVARNIEKLEQTKLELGTNVEIVEMDISKEEKDIIAEIVVKKTGVVRKTVGDTDIGKKLKIQIEDLLELLDNYQAGKLKQIN